MELPTTGPLSRYSKDNLKWAYELFRLPDSGGRLYVFSGFPAPQYQYLFEDVARHCGAKTVIVAAGGNERVAAAAIGGDAVAEVELIGVYCSSCIIEAIANFACKENTRLMIRSCTAESNLIAAVASSNLVGLSITTSVDNIFNPVLVSSVLVTLQRIEELGLTLFAGSRELTDDDARRLAFAATASRCLRTLSLQGSYADRIVQYIYDHVLPGNNSICYLHAPTPSPFQYQTLLGSNWHLREIYGSSTQNIINFGADWGRKRVRSFVSAAAAEISPAEATAAAEILVRLLPEMFEGRPDRNLATRILCAHRRAAYARQHPKKV